MVKVEEEVILALADAFDLAQVARLELGVEEDGLSDCGGGHFFSPSAR